MVNEDKEDIERLAILETKVDAIQEKVEQGFEDMGQRIDSMASKYATEQEMKNKISNLKSEQEELKERIRFIRKWFYRAAAGFASALVTIIVILGQEVLL